MLSMIYSSKSNAEDGFTLIELLIVVIIIGILAAIALPIFIDQQKVAVDASVASDVRNSVTNITNTQAQGLGTAKAAVSNDATNVALVAVGRDAAANSAATTDIATRSDFELNNVPALGSTYTVQGWNAGGKKYQGLAETGKGAYLFTAETGRFTQATTASTTTGGAGGTGGTPVNDATHFVTPALAVGSNTAGPSYVSANNGGLRIISQGTGSGVRLETNEADGEELVSSDAALNGAKPTPTNNVYTSLVSNVKAFTAGGVAVANNFSDCSFRLDYQNLQGQVGNNTHGHAAYYAQLSCGTGSFSAADASSFVANGGYFTFNSAPDASTNAGKPGAVAAGTNKFTVPANLISIS